MYTSDPDPKTRISAKYMHFYNISNSFRAETVLQLPQTKQVAMD